jgi:hypothetical protein
VKRGLGALGGEVEHRLNLLPRDMKVFKNFFY